MNIFPGIGKLYWNLLCPSGADAKLGALSPCVTAEHPIQGWQGWGGCHGQQRGRDQLAQRGGAPGSGAKDGAAAPGTSCPLAGRRGQRLPGQTVSVSLCGEPARRDGQGRGQPARGDPQPLSSSWQGSHPSLAAPDPSHVPCQAPAQPPCVPHELRVRLCQGSRNWSLAVRGAILLKATVPQTWQRGL